MAQCSMALSGLSRDDQQVKISLCFLKTFQHSAECWNVLSKGGSVPTRGKVFDQENSREQVSVLQADNAVQALQASGCGMIRFAVLFE